MSQPLTMRSLCNHCEKDHHCPETGQPTTTTTTTRRSHQQHHAAGQTGRRETVQRNQRSVVSRGSVERHKSSGARKRLSNSADYVSDEWPAGQTEQTTVTSTPPGSVSNGGDRSPGKCIICRSNCTDINECQRATITTAHGPCGRVSRTAECYCEVMGEERQRPVNSVTEMSETCFREMSSQHTASACAASSEPESLRSRRSAGGEGTGVTSERKSAGQRFNLRGSLFILLVALFLSSSATMSPWNVGEMLMGPGAVLVHGKELRPEMGNATEGNATGGE